jgi:hypothetical protein
VVLAGGEQHDPSAGAPVVLLCESLHQQQRRAGIHRVGKVDLLGGELFERLRATAGVVGDQHVEVSECLAGGGDEQRRRRGVGEVGAHVRDVPTLGAQLIDEGLRPAGVCTPRLCSIMRGPGVQQDRRSVGDHPARHGHADGDAPTGPGHQGNAPLQGLGAGHDSIFSHAGVAVSNQRPAAGVCRVRVVGCA